jgi:Flp pilus assembly protein TadG
MSAERTDMVYILSSLLKAAWGRISAHSRVRCLISDRQGVAAIEFALVVPLMLAMCLVTWELALAIDTSRKVGRAGSSIGDLVAQQPAITQDELEAIMGIGSVTIQPYNRSDPVVTVTAIEITAGEAEGDAPEAQVVWSRELVGKDASGDNEFQNGAMPGTSVEVPENLNVAGSFLIRVKSELGYLPVISWEGDQKASLGLKATRSVYDFNETYYLRPRVSQRIACDDCYE